MDNLFKTIEQSFGAFTLRIAVVLFVLYFLGEGFSKLLLSIRDVSAKHRKLEHERNVLEVLKLRCDIEALKKVHGLDHIEIPELTPLHLEPRSKETAAPLARSFAEFLTTLGGVGTIMLLFLTFWLQFTSIFLAGGLLAVNVHTIRHGTFKGSDFTAIALVLAAIFGFGYLGFCVVGRRLGRRSPKTSISATVLAFIGAMACVIYLFGR